MRLLVLTVAFTGLAGAAFAVDNRGQHNGTSLGDLTKAAIAGGFDQGSHASDPSGDGNGRGDADQPRVGLPNLFDRGDLSATIEFLESQ